MGTKLWDKLPRHTQFTENICEFKKKYIYEIDDQSVGYNMYD